MEGDIEQCLWQQILQLCSQQYMLNKRDADPQNKIADINSAIVTGKASFLEIMIEGGR